MPANPADIKAAGEAYLRALELKLDILVPRPEAARLALLTEHMLRDLDASGKGPGGRVCLGLRTGYLKQSFLAWLRGRLAQGLLAFDSRSRLIRA